MSLEADLLEFSKVEARETRRDLINKEMSELMRKGNDCSKCVGHCCTFEHNSMQVSPLEALDTYKFLEENGRITTDLISDLEQCVEHYRLDKETMGMGNRIFRRYYTCPFYKAHSLGCSLDRRSKPYGCLAFNPNTINVSEPGHCSSQINSLERQHQYWGEEEEKINESLRAELNIHWKKTSLPSALLYLIKKFQK